MRPAGDCRRLLLVPGLRLLSGAWEFSGLMTLFRICLSFINGGLFR